MKAISSALLVLATALIFWAMPGTGCGSSGAVYTMTGAFATCAKADLGQIVASGLTLLGDVAAKIEGNAASLEDDLSALAKAVSIDAVQCAIAAVDAVEAAKSTGSGSGAKLTPPSGLARAVAWSKKQKRKSL